jgi:cell division septation protein DedD
MSEENIKKVYVINLDHKRMILMSGLFLLLFGISFFAGLKWNAAETANVVNTTASLNGSVDTGENRVLTSGVAGKENILALPEEDTRIFNQKGKHEKEDPFLADPPDHSVAKTQVNTNTKPNGKTSTKSNDKTARHNAVKKQPDEAMEYGDESENTHGKFYTVQVAAFLHEKDAVSYQAVLKKKNIESRVDTGKKYYYVRSGKSTDKETLQPLLKKINTAMKLQAIVVPQKMS